MPFAEDFRPIYVEIIKPVVEQFGLTCVRADDLYGSKAIIEDIWKFINEAKIIIADLTGKNRRFFRFCVSGDNQPLHLERRFDYATDSTRTAR
jgi:hypothetical protein